MRAGGPIGRFYNIGMNTLEKNVLRGQKPIISVGQVTQYCAGNSTYFIHDKVVFQIFGINNNILSTVQATLLTSFMT